MLKTLLMLAALPMTSIMAQPYPTIGEIVRIDPRMDQLVAKGATIEVLAAGFEWSEGPVWVKEAPGYLLFSDVPKNTIYKWSPEAGCHPFLSPSGYTGLGIYSDEPGSNGLIMDRQGRLIACEHGDRRLTAMPIPGPGGKVSIADRYKGKRFNSPNDVVAHPDGSFYFTDPPYGLAGKADDPTRELNFCGVYRVAPTGEVTLLTSEMSRPNGLAFSPDYKILYIAQSDEQQPIIRAYPVMANGSLGPGRTIFDASGLLKKGHKGLPDGLKVDTKGNLWATGPGGVLVIAPDPAGGLGTLLGRIDPGVATANVAFGNDGHTLYITADMYVCRIQLLAKGAGY